ncbi:MAG: MFS transporter [Lachnospiraceae bacterium]
MMKTTQKDMTGRYTFLNVFFWMASCPIQGFASVFLLSRGFDAAQIGLTLACGNIVAVVVQPVLAAYADKTTKMSLKMVTLLVAGVTLLFMLLLQGAASSFALVFGISVFLAALMNIIQPLINAIGVYYINRGVYVNYGAARGIGSIAFAILSFFMGSFVERFGVVVIIPVGILNYLLFFFVLLTLKIERNEIVEPVKEAGEKIYGNLFDFFIKYKKFTMLLLGIICLFIFHAMINTYLIQIILQAKGNTGHVGPALGVAAACELPPMLFFTRIVRRIPSHHILKIAAFFFGVKSLLFLFASNMPMVFLAEAFQMLSFGLFTPASVFYTNQVMKKYDKVKGLAMIAAAILVGNIIGNLLGGWILEYWGLFTTLLVGCCITLVGIVLVVLFSVGEAQYQTEAEE